MKTTPSSASGQRTVAAAKKTVREEILRWRSGLDQQIWREWSESIASHIYKLLEKYNISSCFIYCSKFPEVDTHDIIDWLLSRDIAVCVPWQPGPSQMQACKFPGWEYMQPGPMGILVPQNPIPCEGDIDLAITPGLAFSEDGARLGYGAGYYDRWFQSHPDTRRVAIAFEAQLRPEIPLESHDLPMHQLITEQRSISINYFI